MNVCSRMTHTYLYPGNTCVFKDTIQCLWGFTFWHQLKLDRTEDNTTSAPENNVSEVSRPGNI